VEKKTEEVDEDKGEEGDTTDGDAQDDEGDVDEDDDSDDERPELNEGAKGVLFYLQTQTTYACFVNGLH
jgi:hypothetical protein